jgi:3-oxoacid CoA-transferase
MGGAMDLISNPDETKIVVATDHVDKHRNPKIVEQCASKQCVFQVDRAKGGLELTELAPGVSVEEVKKKTGAKFSVAENLKVMEA